MRNDRDRPRTVAVEPWANEFILEPGEGIEIVAEGESRTPWFEVVEVEWGDVMQVYIADGVDFQVLKEGAILFPGYRYLYERGA